MQRTGNSGIGPSHSFQPDRIAQAVAAHLPTLASARTARRVGGVLTLGAVLAMTNPLEAATFTVTNTGDSGAGTLRDAVAAANANPDADAIVFDPAVTGAITLTSGELLVNAPLTITGPGASQLAIDGNRSFRVFSNESVLAISGLTITGGAADHGGGIFNTGDLTVSDSIVTGNSATIVGGGIVNYNSGINSYVSAPPSVTLNDSVVTDNTSGRSGGGISNVSYFSGYDATLTITGSRISDNSAGTDGGGIHNLSYYGGASNLVVVNSTISGNHANSAGGSFINRRGGGLFNAGFSADATATIAASTISGNEAVNGGGIYNRADRSFTADLTVSNSTISGNSADYGGGIASFAIEGSTRISLSDSTITANNGSHGTSGIENYHYVFYSSSSVSMTNTIIDGASGGAACHGSDGTFVSNGFNLDNDDTCHLTQSSDLPGTDPLLGPLADNGGPTLTHALLESSPAIDAILAGVNGCGAGVTTDQRGVSRPQAGQPGGTLKCDIGAYERAPESGTVGDFVWRDTNGDGVQDAGEPGIAGVTVTLRIGCAAGNALTTTTDSAGAYHFANLASGNYQLEFIRPAGFSFSPRYAGGDFLVDSNPDPETGLDACRFLAAGQTRDALDAGLVPDTAVAGLGIGDVTVGENAGVAVIPVTLGAAQTATVSVRYITRSGSAKPGRDFRNRRGSLPLRREKPARPSWCRSSTTARPNPPKNSRLPCSHR